MNITENMYYGFGKVALAIAMADGQVDHNEIKFIQERIKEIDKEDHIDLSLVNIVFHDYLKNGSSFSAEEMLENGIHEFHLGDNHLTHKLAYLFRTIIRGLAESEPPTTFEENEAMQIFLKFLEDREDTVTKPY